MQPLVSIVPVSVNSRARSTLRTEEIALLRAALADDPHDPAIHHRLARALARRDPAAAIDHANEALSRMPFAGEAMQPVVVTLAEALRAAGMHSEIVDLAESCRSRWPVFTEMRYRQALAYRELGGHTAEMLEAFEDCLELGEQPSDFATPGAGSYLPSYFLGRFAESQGEGSLARCFYHAALPFEPAADRLAELDGERRRRARARPFTVMACITGEAFDGRFLDAWSRLQERCWDEGVRLVSCRRADPGETPLLGATDYDHLLWLDARSSFAFEDFADLVDVATRAA